MHTWFNFEKEIWFTFDYILYYERKYLKKKNIYITACVLKMWEEFWLNMIH
jgi:hypothetical protein